MIRLNRCKVCGHEPRLGKFQPEGSRWVHFVECSREPCDNAETGDTPEEAAELWNWSNPDPGGNVPAWPADH